MFFYVVVFISVQEDYWKEEIRTAGLTKDRNKPYNFRTFSIVQKTEELRGLCVKETLPSARVWLLYYSEGTPPHTHPTTHSTLFRNRPFSFAM